jgi:hypothetical protein
MLKYNQFKKIENIPYNLIFTTKFNDSLILIMIISWDNLNLYVTMNSQYQSRLLWITNVAPGRSANQIAVLRKMYPKKSK